LISGLLFLGLWSLFSIKAGTLPRGVHFFCLPKRNEPKKRAPDIAFIQKLTLFDGVVENSLRSDTRPINPSNKPNFWWQ